MAHGCPSEAKSCSAGWQRRGFSRTLNCARYLYRRLKLDMTKTLTDAERAAIRAVAAKDNTQFEAAREAFDRVAPANGVSSCVELQFMAEVLAPVPDLLLRARYRAAVLNQTR